MKYELNDTQENFLAEAERLVRREKLLDFFNSPRIFFRRTRNAYYDESLLFHLRWLSAQEDSSDSSDYEAGF